MSRTTRPSRTSAKTRGRKRRNAHSDCDRRLAAASQRRRLDAGTHDAGGGRIRREIRFPHPAGHVDGAAADLPRHSTRDHRRPARSAAQIEEADPDHIHIATEGPIGWLRGATASRHKRIFTTSYHTRFPEYIKARVGVPEPWIYAGLRHFHAPSAAVMAPTPTSAPTSPGAAFPRVRLWTRGVNHALFRPRAQSGARSAAADLPLRRPGGGGKESRGAARARSAWLDRHRRRRPRARFARAPLPPRAFPRRHARRGAGCRSTPAQTCSSFPRAPTRSAS